jgi:class 3 adenylate cyclase
MEGHFDSDALSFRLPACRKPQSGGTTQAAASGSRPRLKRKLATIVVADVAGYSLLMGRDEDGTVRRLRALQAAVSRIVARRGGRTVTIAGDAMLFDFSSSVEAVGCALAIQRLVHWRNRGASDNDKMLFRIGVNLGEVIVEGGDVFGEVVNVASRLEAIADPGGVCVSQAAYLECRRMFAVDFIELGDLRLKNIAEPVRAYAVGIDQSPVSRRVASANVLPWPGRRGAKPQTPLLRSIAVPDGAACPTGAIA